MKTVFEQVPRGTRESFVCQEIRARNFGTPWHVHPEYELTLVLQGGGNRIVGDSIAPVTPGEVVMVGTYVPHVWQKSSGMDDGPDVHALVFQFREDFLGTDFFSRPEAEPMRKLLQRSALGLEVKGETCAEVAEAMQRLVKEDGFRRVVGLLEILDILARSTETVPMCSPGYAPRPDGHDEQRVSRVCQLMNDKLSEAISRPELARAVHMSEGAFSRFFKTRTGKTLPVFLNELRIGRACRLLTDPDASVTEIAVSCGYGNLSNFNRQFKKLKGLTPRDFRRILTGIPENGTQPYVTALAAS